MRAFTLQTDVLHIYTVGELSHYRQMYRSVYSVKIHVIHMYTCTSTDSRKTSKTCIIYMRVTGLE